MCVIVEVKIVINLVMVVIIIVIIIIPQVVLNREPVQLHPDSEYHVSEGIITLLFSLIVVNESLQKNISVVKQKGEIVENEKSIFL